VAEAKGDLDTDEDTRIYIMGGSISRRRLRKIESGGGRVLTPRYGPWYGHGRVPVHLPIRREQMIPVCMKDHTALDKIWKPRHARRITGLCR
jgi:hypothetical protein